MARRPRSRPRRLPALPETPRPPRRQRRAPVGPPPSLEGGTLALVLLRLFLGITFVYAGLDKLIDPTFLRTSGSGSIATQLDAFVRVSPIAILVQIFAQPWPILTGLMVSIAEIAVGLGTLSGLLFRASAVGGASLSLLFWLTASWATKPYYYGPDLPYAAGWIVLAIAGHGERFVFTGWLDRQLEPTDDWSEPISPERRAFLQGTLVGLGALALAIAGGTLGSAIFGHPSESNPLGGTPPSGSGSLLPSGSAPASTLATPAGSVVGTLTDLANQGGSLAFQVPQTGDPGVLVKLGSGKVVAFDAVCTHAGCTVEFDPTSGYLICPCHGATFDPGHAAAVVGGPTNQPLLSLPIRIDQATGAISIVG